MGNKEKLTGSNEAFDTTESARSEQQRLVESRLERNLNKFEKQRDKTAEQARKTLEKIADADKREKAKSNESQKLSHDKERDRGPASKKAKQDSYNKTMKGVRSNLSPSSRAFSKVIHNPAVEKVSDIAGNTVARPNAILAGSAFAFLFTLVVYLVARFNGYPLSGTETIFAFVAGWIAGLVLDYFKLLMFGKK